MMISWFFSAFWGRLHVSRVRCADVWREVRRGGPQPARVPGAGQAQGEAEDQGHGRGHPPPLLPVYRPSQVTLSDTDDWS